MPVYLVHGFRWPREGFTGIRVHAVVHNLEDCSVEYIQNPNSRTELLSSFRKAFPDIMKELEGPGRTLEFIEQYNPEDLDGPHAVSQPYAFVGDKVVTLAAPSGSGVVGVELEAQQRGPSIEGDRPSGPSEPAKPPSQKKLLGPSAPKAIDSAALSVNVGEVIANGPGLTNKAWEALADLRDKIAEGEQIGWWVVYNGDPDRLYEENDEEDEDMDQDMGGVEAENPDQVQHASPGPRALHGQIVPKDGQSSSRAPASSSPQTPGTTQPQRLTALPTRAGKPAADSPSKSEKPEKGDRMDRGKQRDVAPDSAQLKESAKSPGLRKKLFGRRS